MKLLKNTKLLNEKKNGWNEKQNGVHRPSQCRSKERNFSIGLSSWIWNYRAKKNYLTIKIIDYEFNYLLRRVKEQNSINRSIKVVEKKLLNLLTSTAPSSHRTREKEKFLQKNPQN